MSARSSTVPLSISLLLSLVSGCGSAPKPPPPAPPPAPVVAQKPKPKEDPFEKPLPPPPKCESMEEKCVADKATHARVAEAGAVMFVPPNGWTYAQEATVSIAQTSDDGPAIAIAAAKTVVPAKGPGPMEHLRDTTLQALAERLGVKLPKQKIAWKKIDKTLTIGSYSIALYQVEGATRAGKKGPLLVFTTPLEGTRILLGIGFVDDDDQTDADGAILASIQSIAPAPVLDTTTSSAETTTPTTTTKEPAEGKSKAQKDPFDDKKKQP